MPVREEVSNFVKAFWNDASRGTASSALPQIALCLDAIVRDTDILESEESPERLANEKKPVAVFSAKRQALWFNRPALARWTKQRSVALPRARDEKFDSPLWFYDRREIANTILPYLEEGRQLEFWQIRQDRIGDLPSI